MSDISNTVKIVWESFHDELIQSLEKGGFKAAVDVVIEEGIPGVITEIAVAAIGPVGPFARPLIFPVVKYLIHLSENAIRDSHKRLHQRWYPGKYTITTIKSGIAVLKRSEPITQSREIATPPDRLLIPMVTFTKPKRDRRYVPPVSLPRGVWQWSATPWDAFREYGTRSGFLSVDAIPPLNSDPSLYHLTQTVYPGWIFGQRPSVQTAHHVPGLWDWYMNTDRLEFGYWERMADERQTRQKTKDDYKYMYGHVFVNGVCRDCGCSLGYVESFQPACKKAH